MSKHLSDQEIRRRYRGDRGRTDPATGCPDDDTIWAASNGELSTARSRKLLDHVGVCAACRESWRMAHEISNLAELPQASSRRSKRNFVWLGAAAAAVLLALIVLPPLLQQGPTSPTGEFRDADALAILPRIDERSPQPRNSLVLRWTPVQKGSLYRVELATEELEVIHRSRQIEQPEYPVPVDALSDIEPGTTLFWRVDVLLPDDTRLSSPTFRVIVE